MQKTHTLAKMDYEASGAANRCKPHKYTRTAYPFWLRVVCSLPALGLAFYLVGCAERGSETETEAEAVNEETVSTPARPPVFHALGHRELSLWDHLYDSAGEDPQRLALLVADAAEKLGMQVEMLEREIELDEPELVAEFHKLKDELTSLVTPQTLDEAADRGAEIIAPETIAEVWRNLEKAYDSIVVAVSEI